MAGWLIALPLLVTCFIGCHSASERGKYFVTVPESALVGDSLKLTVQVFESPSPVNFSAYIEAYSGYDYNLHQENYKIVTPIASHSIVPGAVETLTFLVPEALNSENWSRYRLHVRGTGGLQIEETYSIAVNKHFVSVFVQNDKKTYAPGDTVMFKTFGFYKKDLTPYSGVYDISLSAGGVVFKRWKSTSGVAINTFEYQLDTRTIQGTWTITTNSNQSGRRIWNFYVAEKQSDLSISTSGGSGALYNGHVTIESDAIDVKVFLPKTMNSSTDLTGYFEAKDRMGTGVKGRAVITLSSYSTTTKTIEFQGNGSFTFPYNDLSSSSTSVTVRVTDETGITSQGSSTVKVYDRDVKIQFTEQTPAVYKPKLPFTVYIKITNNADEPLHIPADSLYSTVFVYGVGHYRRQVPNTGYRSSTYSGTYPILARKLTLPDSGLMPVDIEIPDDVTRIDLVVTFQGVQRKLILQQADRTKGDHYLQIYLAGSVPTVSHSQSGDVKFRVVSSHPLYELNVETVSRNKIVSVAQPVLTNQTTIGDAHSAEFTLTLTWEMTPVTEVVAYYVVEEDRVVHDVISDSMALNVEALLDNRVSMTSSAQRVTPGQEVIITVQSAAPGANVGILVEETDGVSTQTITPQSVMAVLQSQSYTPLNEAMATTQEHGTSNFQAAHLHLLTGGALNIAIGLTSPLRQTAGTQQTSGTKANSIFLGTNITGADGSATFTVTLPDTVSSWSVNGFVFDNIGSIAVVDNPLQIEATYDVYGEILGPDHVISGDHVVLTAFVHNTRTVESQVNVILKAKANAQILTISQNGQNQTTSDQSVQTITIPALNSKEVKFTVVSQAPMPHYVDTAELKLVLNSGDSKQSVSHFYTIAPQGVEKTFTFSELTRVDGHAVKDLSPAQAFPPQALQGTTTTRVLLEERFSDLVLPAVLEERDLMEEDEAGLAALLHFSLPVMLAKHRPDMASQLTAPMSHGYQRLMNYLQVKNHNRYMGNAGYKDWVDITAMRMMAEAKQFIHVEDSRVTSILFHYYAASNQDSTLFSAYSRLPTVLQELEALEAYYAISIQDLHNYVSVRGHGTFNHTDNYDWIMLRLHNFLPGTHSTTNPLALSYLALACVKYGFSANASHLFTQLWDSSYSEGDETFWATLNKNDTFRYFGDWMPGRHVAQSADIVTAANALQVLVYTGQMGNAERVARWLFRQRTGNGMFKTAWDTLAATEALLVYENRPDAANSHVRIDRQLTAGQSSRWMTDGQVTNFTASGHGDVYSQVEVKYHVQQTEGDSVFEIVPVVLDETLNHFKLMICSRWMLSQGGSGVTVQEVTIPTGFMTNTQDLLLQSNIMSVIQRNSTAFTVYWSQIGRDSTCYTLDVNRIYTSAHTSLGYIYTRVFDKPELQDITTYQTRRLAVSNLCDQDLCPTCCS